MNPQELRTGNFLSYDGRICIVTNIDSTGNFKLAPNGVFFCEFVGEPLLTDSMVKAIEKELFKILNV